MRKVAILTGVRRIGRHLAEALLREGYDLGVVYRESADAVERLVEFGRSVGRRVVPVEADLGDPSLCGDVVEQVCAELGRVDALLHLASPYRRTPVDKLDLKDLREHMAPTAEAFVLLSVHAFRRMLSNEGNVKGRVIAFGDWAVENTPYRGYTAYFLSKGTLHTAVRVLAKEFAPHVLVNCIALGPTLRPEDLDRRAWERVLKNTPLGREVSLKDVVELSLFLLRAESLTGEVIRLDCGRHLAGSGVGGVE